MEIETNVINNNIFKKIIFKNKSKRERNFIIYHFLVKSKPRKTNETIWKLPFLGEPHPFQLTPYFWTIFSWPTSLSKFQQQDPPHPRHGCHSQMFFAMSTRKHLMLESFFNKVAGLKACNFIQKRLQHRCFPVNIAKYL